MSDDDLPMNAELASAYLDGELTDAERAAVAADPAALTMVDSFTRVRAQLGAVTPVDEAVRSHDVAAALAEFDAQNDTSTPTEAADGATVTPLAPRRMRTYKIVTGIAAAVVLVVGVAALNSRSDNNSNATSQEAASVPTANLPQLKAAADTAAAAGTVAPAGTAAGAAGAAATEAVSAFPEINTVAELQQYATAFRATTAPSASSAANAQPAPAAADSAQAAPPPPCLAGQIVLGQIIYKGTPAFVVVDNSGFVAALDATDCRVIETAP